MSVRSDRQRELARQALKAEAQCLQALNHIPAAQSILDTPQLRRAQTRGLMVERIPDALAAAEVFARDDASLRKHLNLARAAWSDAEGLRWQMVGEVEGLIRQRAGKIARTSRLEIEDLVQEGRLGALRAARRYDPDAQNFTTYAQWWIRAAMTRSVDVEGRLVRLPGGLVEQQRQLNRIIVDIVASGETVTDERLSQLSGIEPERVKLIRSQSRPVSLDVSPGSSDSGDEGVPLGMMLADEHTPDPEQEAITAAMMAQVEELLAGLPPRTREAVMLYYGLGDEPPLTLSALGKRMNLSRERVRQIINQAVQTIRPRLGVSVRPPSRTYRPPPRPSVPSRKPRRIIKPVRQRRLTIQERLAALLQEPEDTEETER
ncbi:MAG: sigma-70 family RNA polymerase sigma factor [Myxococcota bacterium]|nr:sigma-70 family RNA polymerase sigma factor [Myxococcota bacterium]